jgi:hypothetical protein
MSPRQKSQVRQRELSDGSVGSANQSDEAESDQDDEECSEQGRDHKNDPPILDEKNRRDQKDYPSERVTTLTRECGQIIRVSYEFHVLDARETL